MTKDHSLLTRKDNAMHVTVKGKFTFVSASSSVSDDPFDDHATVEVELRIPMSEFSKEKLRDLAQISRGYDAYLTLSNDDIVKRLYSIIITET